ncbi:hypothetical protein KGF54_003241 [Candida jiufengensis]|uniref:uncharacterized protein n=1 Tax=Candida jiufengensis TaxID=497108 RepID=UPI002225A6F2|nr:uncharacterized protein KGF54_003241 [Candida jiufengensis]KAI5952374.1 hypothetical protein KGF54_003241 [Candida jiufengensis]
MPSAQSFGSLNGAAQLKTSINGYDSLPSNFLKEPSHKNRSPFKFRDKVIKKGKKQTTLLNSSNTFENITETPKPLIVYSANTSGYDNLEERSNEIVKTELSYVNDCKELFRFYYSNFELPHHELPTPFIIAKECLEKIIESHDKLTQVFDGIKNDRSGSIAEQTENILEAISKEGLEIFYYLYYCSNSIAVNKISNIFNSNDEVDDCTFSNSFELSKKVKIAVDQYQKGIEQHLSSINQGELKRNLSFQALHHNGMSRIFHYLVFARAVIDDFESIDRDTTKILEIHNEIDSKINKINNQNNTNSINEKLNLIVDFKRYLTKQNQYFKFEKLCFKFNDLSSEFFGVPIYIGVGFVVYIKGNKPILKHYAILLFKGHLILLKYVEKLKRNKTLKRYVPQFIIPLVKCSIITDDTDQDGIQVNLVGNIKLRFLIQSTQFEIVLLFLTQEESNIWFEKLDLLINHIHNGSCSESKDHFIYLNQVPKSIKAYYLLESPSDYMVFQNVCYYKNQFTVNFNYSGLMKKGNYKFQTDTEMNCQYSVQLWSSQIWAHKHIFADMHNMNNNLQNIDEQIEYEENSILKYGTIDASTLN